MSAAAVAPTPPPRRCPGCQQLLPTLYYTPGNRLCKPCRAARARAAYAVRKGRTPRGYVRDAAVLSARPSAQAVSVAQRVDEAAPGLLAFRGMQVPCWVVAVQWRRHQLLSAATAAPRWWVHPSIAAVIEAYLLAGGNQTAAYAILRASGLTSARRTIRRVVDRMLERMYQWDSREAGAEQVQWV